MATIKISEAGFPDYETLATFKDVKVKLPALTGYYINKVPAHVLQTSKGPAKIKEHFVNGVLLTSGQPGMDAKIFRHYYGFSRYEFGGYFNAVVEVVHKISRDGEFILINFFKSDGISDKEIKFREDIAGEITGIRIPSSYFKVCVQALKPTKTGP